MKRGAKPGSTARGYEGLGHRERADLSEYLERLRLRAGLSREGLADASGIEAKRIEYFESHPSAPLAKKSRRDELRRLCLCLANRNGHSRGEVLIEVNRLAGGVG